MSMLPTDRAPTPPGEMLREEFLKPPGLARAELAKKLGMALGAVNAIINGKRIVTPGTAMRLAKALGTTPEFWISGQIAVDLHVAANARSWRRQVAGDAAGYRDSPVRWSGMREQSHNVATPDSARIRSFAVEAFIGHPVTRWPLARFDISSSELRVRLSFPWFTTRSRQASAIRAVIVTRRFGNMYWIGFDDAAGRLGDVHVHAIYRRQQVLDELLSCGYHVVDTGPRARAPRRPWRHN